jgi:hypothetical protein
MLAHDPTRRVTRKIKKINDHNQTPPLLNMPTEIILGISERLDIVDRAVLALTCKDIAAKLQANNHLDWEGPGSYVPKEEHYRSDRNLLELFHGQLGDWDPLRSEVVSVLGQISSL